VNETLRSRGSASRVVAADAHRLLGEPPQEVRAVGDLGPRLGQRLAHLQGDELCDLLGARDHRVERAVQDLGALPRRRGGPAGPRRCRGVERTHGVDLGGVGHGAQHLARGGVRDVERGALGGLLRPPGDPDALGERVEHGVGRRHGVLLGGRVVVVGAVRGRCRSVLTGRQNDLAGRLARAEGVEGPVEVVEPDVRRDQPVHRQVAAQVHPGVFTDIGGGVTGSGVGADQRPGLEHQRCPCDRGVR